jgi:acetyl-CoA C-acetyltransferase
MREAVIVSAVRTPIGSLNGSLCGYSAPRLGSLTIEAALHGVAVSGEVVDEVIMGTVLSAGQGQAPARQACLGAGLPKSVGCLTINKVCGSGLMSVILAAQTIQGGHAEIIVAGGMESMSQAPYLVENVRAGYRMGHGKLIDSMIKDGLWDVYNNFHMGMGAELCAEEFKISRSEQDDFAAQSYHRASMAQRRGEFAQEIVPLKPANGSGAAIQEDEEVKKFDAVKLRSLKPAFKENGTVTAGNSSSVSDGAAALVIMAEESAKKHQIRPLARIIEWCRTSRAPEWFTIAPVQAISGVITKTGFSINDVDLFEVNEAFAAASIAVNRKLGLDPEKINIRGGAIALGHPIGASGTRILVTLIHALRHNGKQRGIASLCIGGGEALALMVEML